MIKDLQNLLKELIKDGADQRAIDALKKLIEKEKKRQESNAKEADAELERLRAQSLSGLQAHLSNLNATQAQFNQRRQKLLEERNEMEAGAARDAKNQELLELEEREKINQRRIQTAQDINRKFEDFGFVTDFKKSKTGRFLSDMEGAFTALGATMASALKPANLFAAGMDQMITATKDLFTSFDQAQASLALTTATTGEYNDMLYDLQEANKTFGVDSKVAGEAIGKLHTELSAFNQMSSDTQGMLAETTARMDKLGVKTSVGAKQFDNMIQGMGMTATMANDASMELIALGGAIGMAADTISEGFNTAAQELAKYGSDAIDVFKGLASAAKATGIEMSSLTNIAKQFDTFEGAAQGAGKLNAILGGGVINSMDLLNGTEEERIRLLIQSMQLSGKNFESLNRFEKQAIASAAGIQDMTEANKLFSMSLSAYDEMQAKGSEVNAEAAMMEERAQAVTTLSDKLKAIGQSFAIAFMPVLEFMHGFANIILEINDMTGGMFVPAMVGLIGVIALLTKTTAISNAVMQVGLGIRAASALVTGGFSAAQGVLAGTTAAEGAAAAAAAPANVALAGSFATMLPLVLPLVPAIAGLGFAIGGLGLAIAAPFLAIAALAIAFKDLFVAMLQAPEAIMSAITGIIGFAASAAIAMNILALAMIPFSIAMFTASIFLFPAGILLQPFAAALLIAAPAFYLFGAAIESLSEGLDSLLSIKISELPAMMLGLTSFTLGMIFLAPFLSIIGTLVGIPLMLFGAGLKSFAKGIKEFNKIGGEEIMAAVNSLTAMTLNLIPLVVPLTVIGLLVGIPLMMLGAGLKSFAEGMREFNKVGATEIDRAVGSLTIMTLLLMALTVPLFVVGVLISLPLMMLSSALGMFAEKLNEFNKIGGKEIISAVAALTFLSVALIPALFPLTIIAPMISAPLVMLGIGLGFLADGLKDFSDIGVGGVATAIFALFQLGAAMLFMLPLIPFMVVNFTLLAGPMMLFGTGLAAIGLGLLLIGGGMATFAGLGETLSVIAEIGAVGAAVMGTLAVSIMGIALAMSFIPESKTIAFGFAMEGYGAALAAVAALSPETVELSERVVAAAGEYAEVQAEMRMPDEDSFVQAMKNVFGGDNRGGAGQDIVLQLNGREFGRAVDVQLNKMHNLSID